MAILALFNIPQRITLLFFPIMKVTVSDIHFPILFFAFIRRNNLNSLSILLITVHVSSSYWTLSFLKQPDLPIPVTFAALIINALYPLLSILFHASELAYTTMYNNLISLANFLPFPFFNSSVPHFRPQPFFVFVFCTDSHRAYVASLY